ncbi:MAG: DUF2299 family protein [Promethearchaeota archaeon]
MTINIENTKRIIQEYLIDEGLFKKKHEGPNITFGYQFTYPPGPQGHPLSVVNPKGKDFILLTAGIQISEPYVNALNSLKNNKKMQFFKELRKFLVLKNIFFRIDGQNHRYEIFDQIFLKKDGSVSKNTFFKSIRYLFNCTQYSTLILDDFCSGHIKHVDSSKIIGDGYSFYT